MRGLLIATAVAGLAAPASSPPATSQPKPPSWSEPGPPSPSSQTAPWWSGDGSGRTAPSGSGGARAVHGGGWPSQGGDRTSGGGAPGDAAPGGSTRGWDRAGGPPDRAAWGAGQPQGEATYRGSFARPRSVTPAAGARAYHGSRRGTAHTPSPSRAHARGGGSAATGAAPAGGSQDGVAQPMR